MVLEDLSFLKDLGIGSVSLAIIYVLGKKVTDNAFKQVDEANKRGETIHQQFIDFVQNAYKENTKTIERFCNVFDNHLKAKEATLEMLREQQELLKRQINDSKKQVPKEYRK